MASVVDTTVHDELAPVFRALATDGRRTLLDALFEHDGQTVGELCAVPAGLVDLSDRSEGV